MTNTPDRDALEAAHARVVDRMDTKGESLDAAIEAVYPDYGGLTFAAQLKAFAQGDRAPIREE